MKSDLMKEMEVVFEETYARHMVDKVGTSWFMQHRDERRRRMDFVLRLTNELRKLREGGTVLCTAWAEWAIEAVIVGDLDELKMWGIDGLSEADFAKNIGPQEAPALAKTYAAFREICEEAHLTGKPKEVV